MPSRTPARNRLARPLPVQWRDWLVGQGVPKRKYTAVVNVILTDGQTVDEVVIEEGWIVAVGLDALTSDAFEQRIDFDPDAIETMMLAQVI